MSSIIKCPEDFEKIKGFYKSFYPSISESLHIYFNLSQNVSPFIHTWNILNIVSHKTIKIQLLFYFHTARKVSKYGVFSGPCFPAFGLNKERYSVSLRIRSECRKIRIRKNSVFGHFSLSAKFTFDWTHRKQLNCTHFKVVWINYVRDTTAIVTESFCDIYCK